MKSIYTFRDPHLGSVNIVIPKIREVSKGLGSVVVTYDNGDKRNLESKQPDDLIAELVKLIEECYK
jgi:hypothetical protein